MKVFNNRICLNLSYDRFKEYLLASCEGSDVISLHKKSDFDELG